MCKSEKKRKGEQDWGTLEGKGRRRGLGYLAGGP